MRVPQSVMFISGFKLKAVFDQEKQWVGKEPAEQDGRNCSMTFPNVQRLFFIDDALNFTHSWQKMRKL